VKIVFFWAKFSPERVGLPADPLSTIKDTDFVFENMLVKIVANRDSPKISLPGIEVWPFKEGKEYEVRYWIAQELKNAGVAHIRMEEPLDLQVLNKIHWKEARVQSSQRLTMLPEDFYPKLRRYLVELGEEAIRNPEARIPYEKARKLAEDITRTRLKKIVSLASSAAQTVQVLGNLTKEERALYDFLYEKISKWRTEILKDQRSSRT